MCIICILVSIFQELIIIYNRLLKHNYVQYMLHSLKIKFYCLNEYRTCVDSIPEGLISMNM